MPPEARVVGRGRPVKGRRKKRWDHLSQWQRGGLVAAVAVQLRLLPAAMVDRWRRPADDELRGSKAVWTAVSCVNFVGPITYFLCGRRR